jgi:hypothetical protein
LKCFVYCEWIDDDRLKKSMPKARLIERVVLPGHRLVFTSFVEDGDQVTRSGGCHLIKADGYSVPGLLYELSEEEQRIAETLSRVPQGRYIPTQFEVIDNTGNNHTAIAYIIKHPIGPSSAPDEYRAHMLAGARKHGFSEDYLRMLESL